MEKNMDTNFDFNKTGKFDFGKVGKRMPYSTPEGFFKEMEANILEQVCPRIFFWQCLFPR